MEAIFSVENLVALLTLVTLEIVLGIDNVIFIAILSGKLPESQQARARSTGIGLAVITRILLLFSITFIILTTEGVKRGLRQAQATLHPLTRSPAHPLTRSPLHFLPTAPQTHP